MKIIMQTERIAFVPIDEQYAQFYVENMNNPEIYQYLTTTPHIYTYEEEIEWIQNNKQFHQFTIIDRPTNTLIGNAGINNIENETGELGIWITPIAQNKHYGYEILNTLIEFCYHELNLKHITLKVHDNNERAKHLYEKIGFIKTGEEENITDVFGNPTKSIGMILKKERR